MYVNDDDWRVLLDTLHQLTDIRTCDYTNGACREHQLWGQFDTTPTADNRKPAKLHKEDR